LGFNNVNLIELPSKVKEFLYCDYRLKSMDELSLTDDIKSGIDKFIKEYKKKDVIKEAGLPVRNRMLFYGESGNGKTSLASALAKELEMPFYVVNLSKTISSYMGTSSKNISELFCGLQVGGCVLLMDEVDCIGHRRTNGKDSADKERNLTTSQLFLELDRLNEDIIVIGTTNMPDLLDKAFVRRFNFEIVMPKPTEEAIDKYIRDYETKHNIKIKIEYEMGELISWAKVEQYCWDKHRDIILGD